MQRFVPNTDDSVRELFESYKTAVIEGPASFNIRRWPRIAPLFSSSLTLSTIPTILERGDSSVILQQLHEWLADNPKMSLATLPLHKPDLVCQIVHPGTTCHHDAFQFFLGGIRRSLPVYLPVYLLPALVLRLKKLKRQPKQESKKLLVNISRSTLFLAMYCTVAWLSLCTQRRISMLQIPSSASTWLIASPLSGATVLLEKKERRIELALYVLSQALYTFWQQWSQRGLFRPIPGSDLVLFAVASGAILRSFVYKTELLRPSYVSLLTFLFGRGGRKFQQQ